MGTRPYGLWDYGEGVYGTVDLVDASVVIAGTSAVTAFAAKVVSASVTSTAQSSVTANAAVCPQ